MKQQMLRAALLALTLTSAEMANAQPFTANSSYGTSGFSNYSTSGKSLGLVNGNGGNGYQYVVGSDIVSSDVYITQINATNGNIISSFTFDAGNSLTDNPSNICEDQSGSKLYVVGVSGSSPNIPFLMQLNISSGTPIFSAAVNLPIIGSTCTPKDVTVDASGNIYIMVYDDAAGGQYDIFKYNSSLTLVNAFFSNVGRTIGTTIYTGQGLTYNFESFAGAIKIDDVFNRVYVLGTTVVSPNYHGYLGYLDMSLNYQTDNIYSSSSNYFISMDIDKTTMNHQIVVLSRENTFNIGWRIYDAGMPGMPSLTLSTSGASTVNGKLGSNVEDPIQLLIDNNGNYDILMEWYGATTQYNYITYINKAVTPWDIYYGSNEYALPVFVSDPLIYFMHKDNNGKIVASGEYSPSNNFTLSLNNPAASGGWSNYENKHTAVTNVTAANGFTVYPNPAQNELNISLPADGKYTCRIMNSLGQLVASQNISDGKQAAQINITSLAAGQYYVQLQQENKTIGTTAFVKE